eukprot:1377217-Amorphochlora_amoeboformis.AAC.1
MSSKRVRKESDLSAEELKSRGNKSFVDKKYDESVKWYFSPFENYLDPVNSSLRVAYAIAFRWIHLSTYSHSTV